MTATTRSMSRLSGSMRKPKRMLISPPATQRAEYSIGRARLQCFTSRKPALRSETLIATMDSPAESRGQPRVNKRMTTNATNGMPVARMAATRVVSMGPAAVMVYFSTL